MGRAVQPAIFPDTDSRIEIYPRKGNGRCRAWPTISVGIFLTGVPAPLLFERRDAVLDGEFDERGEVVDIELFHHAGSVGFHGFR